MLADVVATLYSLLIYCGVIIRDLVMFLKYETSVYIHGPGW